MCQRESIRTKLLSVIVFCFLANIVFPSSTFARSREFTLSSPYWYIDYDRAGYVDITYWYPSPLHPFNAHEMMTGNWAAAVSYSGLNETGTAEWLTDQFIIPDFSTGSPFDFDAYSVSNDPDNPVWKDPNQPSNPPYSSIQNDTGWSKMIMINLR